MLRSSRRSFLSHVGRGMLVGSVGVSLAHDLGISTVFAGEDSDRITFGDMEPLVALMQDTPLDRLQSTLVDKIRSGIDLQTLIAAGALANARTFGGQDYIGYHSFMALAPALDMSRELPSARQPLPVLKVLYRNTDRIQQFGGSGAEVLHHVEPSALPSGPEPGLTLQEATRAAEWDRAEGIFAAMANEPPGEMFNHVQYPVQDSANVHRVVLAWRAWLAIDLVGAEYSHTLLRQSVRFCCQESQYSIDRNHPQPELWTLVPRVLDEYQLLGRTLGNRQGDDTFVQELAWTIFGSAPVAAAEAAAQAIVEGYDPEVIGEAMSIAANLLLLHDPGRTGNQIQDGKPEGSVHGDSVGVHASDAANAWRNIARVSNQRNAVVSLLVGAYHTAGQSGRVLPEPWPLRFDAIERETDPAVLLATAEEAIQDRDQALAGAAVHRIGERGGASRPVFDMLLKYSTSEDGSLHAEKYYRTVTEEFATTRESLRWRQLVGLARVCASEYGRKAAGYDEACELLQV